MIIEFEVQYGYEYIAVIFVFEVSSDLAVFIYGGDYLNFAIPLGAGGGDTKILLIQQRDQ